MKALSRRETVLLGFLGAVAVPGTVAAAAAKGPAFLTKFKRDPFMQRDDIDKAIKSYYMSYDCTSPYPHKFNEVVVKWQLRTLQFHVDHGTEKENGRNIEIDVEKSPGGP